MPCSSPLRRGRGRRPPPAGDADSRLSGPAGSGYAAITYPTDTAVNLGRNADGQITGLNDTSGGWSATYYPGGGLETLDNSLGRTATYQYNAAGLRSVFTNLQGTNTTYTYNALNQLASLTNDDGDTFGFTYDNGGRLSEITRPGSTTQYQYNARNWLTGLLNHKSSNNATIYDVTYAYNSGSQWDNTGNPLVFGENVAGTTYTTTYGYDALYELLQETKKDSGNNTLSDISYTYDPVGNRLTRNLNGTAYSYVYDHNNKLSSVTANSQTSNFGYDGAGNMTSVGAGLLPAWTLTYNDENQLVNVAHGGVTDTYIYDAGGQPIWDSLRSPSECFALSYDGAREIEDDCDNASYLHDRMTYTGGSFFDLFLGIHQYTLTPAIRYPLFDGTGSVRALVDANGTVQDNYTYDAYGVPATGNSTNAQPFRYGGDWGYRTSRSTGLLQLGQRWYWPDLGRFTQQDPVRDGLNWYTYAGNGPVAKIDPTGLLQIGVQGSVSAAGAVGGGIDIGGYIDFSDFWNSGAHVTAAASRAWRLR